jgi:hypothetical protein
MRVLVVLFLLAGCASTEEKQANNEAQIRMIAVQREAQQAEREAAAEAQKELYRSLLGVAQADPSQSGVVAMALAFQGMQGVNSEQPRTPLVALQQQPNEALQWAQALAPVAGGVVSTLGTAIVSGSVQKRQIEATRDVQVNQANQTANAIASVASLGATAANQAGNNYAGDYYAVSDQGAIDQSTTTTSTSTTSSTSAITDSYNSDNSSDSSQNITDSYNPATTLNNTVSMTTSVTWGGEETNLGSMLAYLAGLGSPYSLSIDGVVVASSDEGEGDSVGITCVPDFSPSGFNCTGG